MTVNGECNPYEEGWDAAACYKEYTDNPYSRTELSVHWADWCEGFNDCIDAKDEDANEE